MGEKHFSNKLFIVVFIIFVVIGLSYIIYDLSRDRKLSVEASRKQCNIDAGISYKELTLDVAWLNVDAFSVEQRRSTLNYASLKNGLSLYMQNTKGTYALYFEDLNTGFWFGVNEDEPFMPFSLLKVPVMVAVLKEAETGRISLNQKIILESEDIDSKYGVLWKKGVGYEITVQDLLIDLVKHSDNTALLALARHAVSDRTLIETKLAIGLPLVAEEDTVSPKQYSNMLRSLYFSHYLRKPFSELALALMMDTDFDSQLPAGLPKDVKIAHKVGIYTLEGTYHDCGIIFAENNPYVLCVMSKNTNLEEADKVISQISKMVYDYVSKENKTD